MNGTGIGNSGGDLLEEIKGMYRDGSMLVRLIFINVAVFIGLNLLYLFLFFFQKDGSFLIDWLAASSDPWTLITRPWTAITYMFLHENFFHLLFNMIILFFGGYIFMQFLGEERLLSTYILGGLAGLGLYVICYNIFPVFEQNIGIPILGASAAIMAVLIAAATYRPNYGVYLFIFGPIKLKWIALFYIVLDLISIREGNPGGHISHLGGALMGYLSIVRMRKGKDLVMPFYRFILSIPEAFTSDNKSKRKMKVEHKKPRAARMTDEEYNEMRAREEQEIDEILDKISKSGYESLTKKEKEKLFRESRKR